MVKTDKNAGQGVLKLEKAGESQPQKIKSTIINQSHLATVQKSRSYRSKLLQSPRTGKPFFYFRYHGQSLEGFLGTSHDCAFFSRGSSRIIETIDGSTEEFFTGSYLAKLFEANKLEGKHIKITYVGDQLTNFGHARKVYQVEKFPTTDRRILKTQTEKVKK